MSLKRTGKLLLHRARSGQALVEYALILVMVAILFAVTLAATGPAIGNVFSNTNSSSTRSPGVSFLRFAAK